MTQRKILDTPTLLLLNDVAFGAGKTYIPHEIIVGISIDGIHVIDKQISVNEWANVYLLLCMQDTDDPYEANLEIQIEDYNTLQDGMNI